MAKKKKAAAKKKPAARYLRASASTGTRKALAPRKATAKAKAAKGRQRQGRQIPLPGVDRRLSSLDDICTSIAETRAAMNQLRAEETDYEKTALKLMQRAERTAYRWAGVELVRIPGEEKLRVRTARETTATSDEAPTDAEPESPTIPPDDDQGEDASAEDRLH